MGDLKTPLLRPEGVVRSERPFQHVTDPKKRALGIRSWIRIDNAGNSQVLEVDKFSIMRRCQLPGRDLRLLDPLFVYPSTILGREKAIVVNLEQIRCVITADEVLLLNSLDTYVLQFVTELRSRVAPNKHLNAGAFGWRSPGSQKIDIGSYDLREPIRETHTSGSNNVELLDGLSINSLPFEMKALEVALETACVFLDTQTAELEDEAYPLLEKLATRINTLNLERVRRLKSRLVGLKRRVERVRDEIEQLMDDDQDMAELYLTEKKERANTAAGISVSAPVSPVGSPQGGRTLEKTLSLKPRMEKVIADNNVERVEEIEMLLEAYFVVVDGILNKLTSLEEYIDDTEDLINIHLDHVRNQLIQFELILTTATFVMAFYGIIAGIFGMNIPLPLTDEPWAFKWILITAGLTGIVMFLGVISFLRWRKLMPL